MSKKKASIKIPTTANALPNWWTNTTLQAALLFLLSFLLYINTITHDYTQDDAIVIYDNMFTTKGVAGIEGILKYDTFYGFFKEEGKANLVAGGRYRPLTLILFALEWELFGDNPSVGHLMNILWYGLTVVMLYIVFLRLFKNRKNKLELYFMAFATSLLFAVHPIHTEVVANIKGRDEILTLFGSLAALYCSLRAYDKQQNYWNILAGISFFLALMAKENAITFLAIVPLSFFVFRKVTIGKIALQTLPFLGATVVFLAIRTSILGWGINEVSTELMNNPFVKIVDNRWVDFSTAEWLATIFFTLGKYILLLLFPHPLTHDYYPRQIDIMAFSDWQVIASILLYVGLIVFALVRLPKKNWWAYGILFFLATLSIISNLVFPIGTNMGERFLFMPSVGFCFLLAVVFWRLRNKKLKPLKSLLLSFVCLAIVSVLYSAKTITRNPAWKDNYTLFMTDIKTSKNSAKLRNAVAGELTTLAANESDPNKRQQMLLEAEGHLKEAIRIHPTYKNAYLLLGNTYSYLEKFDKAVNNYNIALQIDPDFQDALNNLAITYTNAGRYFGEKKGDVQTSTQYLKKALELRPNDIESLRLLGIASGIQGNPSAAIEYLTKAAKLAPQNASILYNLGAAYMQINKVQKGQSLIEKAKQIDPSIGR